MRFLHMFLPAHTVPSDLPDADGLPASPRQNRSNRSSYKYSRLIVIPLPVLRQSETPPVFRGNRLFYLLYYPDWLPYIFSWHHNNKHFSLPVGLLSAHLHSARQSESAIRKQAEYPVLDYL